ncbi:MAG: UDP-glucose/GDP-mannose dehydrogenase family protein [Planctomycetes bacterium]|nr:UDP-glucose/GDP-mannose dehydrogenase family protein [Planctomycetota bacterium]NOG54508.1 UDP-glucose/GDP-mannose dehydrogenase family protein [Planctomycetota bacterium]
MKLTMVGTGYVGLVTGTCFANTGNKVKCLDVDEAKIAMLNRGEVPIFEPGLEELIKRNVAVGRLAFMSDKTEAYANAQIIFICVGTPSDEEGHANLCYVKQAAKDIAQVIDTLGPDQPPKTIVVKSTVPVGTTHMVQATIRQHTDAPFHVANNPEFLKEGDAVNDFNRPDRVVCGVETDEVAELMKDLYDPFVRQGNPIYIMDIRSSEMVKYASNAMLATKISFINEIAHLCEQYGANISQVRVGMCSDHRIGNQFLFPGLGYGGSCFPKDTLACISMGSEAGFETKLLRAVHDVNQDQRQRFFNKIMARFDGSLSGKTFAVWGLAFKPRTDDIREAPAIDLVRWMTEQGASVKAYDRVAGANVAALNLNNLEICNDMYECAEDADALIICTDWDEFKNPDFDLLRASLQSPLIFDGRNLYRRPHLADMGFTYISIGRHPIEPTEAE